MSAPRVPMRWPAILGLLLGLPAASTLLSCLLLERERFAAAGVDFRLVFWPLATAWYAAQIAILARVLRANGWGWRDIGYGLGRRGTAWLVAGYLIFAGLLVALVESALAGTGMDAEALARLSDFADLSPADTAQRVLYVLMGLVAAPCEELVYRGFAINALRSRGWSAWLAVPAASIPFVFQHGLKSIDQFWWFLAWGVVFGAAFALLRKLYANIVVHWLVILSAIAAILQALD